MADLYQRLSRTTGLTLTNNSKTKITGLSQEKSVGTGWNNTNQNYTVPNAGTFRCYAKAQWTGDQPGQHILYVFLNGNEIALVQNDGAITAVSGITPSGMIHSGWCDLDCAVNDVIDFRARQQTGANAELGAVIEATIEWLRA